jgi:ferredoxin
MFWNFRQSDRDTFLRKEMVQGSKQLKTSSIKRYLIALAAAISTASCIAVYLYFGPTASLILAQLIALPAALVFILDSKLRHKRSKPGSEWWTGLVVEGKKIRVHVDWNSCMGASSCVKISPKVFRLDWEKKKSIFDPVPLELLDDRAKGTDPELVFFAAQSCPYRAIVLEDDETKERIFP